MKKYNVTVNGETYTVEVEEVGACYAPAAAPVAPAPAAQPAPVAAPAPAAAPAPVSQPKPKADCGPGLDISSPLPGTVLRIVAKEGQTVKTGDLLLVLEAMKMENDIVAPEDGVVKSISVKAGETVQAGDLLLVI